jgi:hypothetical protein
VDDKKYHATCTSIRRRFSRADDSAELEEVMSLGERREDPRGSSKQRFSTYDSHSRRACVITRVKANVARFGAKTPASSPAQTRRPLFHPSSARFRSSLNLRGYNETRLSSSSTFHGWKSAKSPTLQLYEDVQFVCCKAPSRPPSLAFLAVRTWKSRTKGGAKFALILNFCATSRRLFKKSQLFLNPTSCESLRSRRMSRGGRG